MRRRSINIRKYGTVISAGIIAGVLRGAVSGGAYIAANQYMGQKLFRVAAVSMVKRLNDAVILYALVFFLTGLVAVFFVRSLRLLKRLTFTAPSWGAS